MRFVIEIDDDWLDALDALIKLISTQEDSSPESALEKTICAQIKEQRKDEQ